jgi:hypothetical protein
MGNARLNELWSRSTGGGRGRYSSGMTEGAVEDLKDEAGPGDSELPVDVPTTAIFKLRAECPSDIGELLKRVGARRIEIETLETGDVEAIITGPMLRGRSLDLATLRAILFEVEDCHLMAETVAPLAKYTGERTYGKARAGKA